MRILRESENRADHSYKVKDRDELKALVKNAKSNEDLNYLDVSDIKYMDSIFSNTSFNGNISRWDMSHVISMTYMFAYSKFNGDISQWDVSHVTDMNYTFYKSEFNGDISSWNVRSLNDMDHTFAQSRFDGDISGWDVRSLKRMDHTFYGCPAKVPSWYTGKIYKYKNIAAPRVLQSTFKGLSKEENKILSSPGVMKEFLEDLKAMVEYEEENPGVDAAYKELKDQPSWYVDMGHVYKSTPAFKKAYLSVFGYDKMDEDELYYFQKDLIDDIFKNNRDKINDILEKYYTEMRK